MADGATQQDVDESRKNGFLDGFAVGLCTLMPSLSNEKIELMRDLAYENYQLKLAKKQ